MRAETLKKHTKPFGEYVALMGDIYEDIRNLHNMGQKYLDLDFWIEGNGTFEHRSHNHIINITGSELDDMLAELRLMGYDVSSRDNDVPYKKLKYRVKWNA